MRASVIVPCWNGLRYTRRCLASVLRSTRGDDEIVVVDNGSRDGTAAYVRALGDPRVRLIRNATNRGFARAMNQGLAAARGEWLVWLNNDTEVPPGWLERLIACARRKKAGAVGPYTNRISGPQKAAAGRYDAKSFPHFAEAWALAHAGRAREVHRLTGFCLLHPRSALEAVGNLDERFGLGNYEDYDFCLRLIQSGRRVYIAEDAFVHHHGHKSFQENGVPASYYERNRRVFVDKWCRKSLTFLDRLDKEQEGR